MKSNGLNCLHTSRQGLNKLDQLLNHSLDRLNNGADVDSAWEQEKLDSVENCLRCAHALRAVPSVRCILHALLARFCFTLTPNKDGLNLILYFHLVGQSINPSVTVNSSKNQATYRKTLLNAKPCLE
jgi:hypothetical protein